MSKKLEEIMEEVKAAKTPEEIAKIVNAELPRTELSAEEVNKVAGGTGRIELTEAQVDKVVGGGHLYTDSMGSSIYVALMDAGYVLGTDPLLDRAYILEGMAAGGFNVCDIISTACHLFSGASPVDVEQALMVGGTVYLAECYRSAHGYHFSPGN